MGFLSQNYVYSEEEIEFKIEGTSSSLSFTNIQQEFYFDAPTILAQTLDGTPQTIIIGFCNVTGWYYYTQIIIFEELEN